MDAPQDPIQLDKMDFQADCRLDKLPQELIDRIVDFLPTPDLGSLRRSCKTMEHHLFNYFSKHFFTKKQFMMTETSLGALIEISEHPTISPCLKHLIIGLDRYLPWEQYPLEESFGYTESVDWKCENEAQRRLFSTGRAVTLLSKALNNLKSLQAIDIRDYNSKTRIRDSESGSDHWRSWGATTLEARGHRLTMLEGDYGMTNNVTTRVFQALLAAMANSSARPHTLMSILRERRWGLPDEAFGLDGWLEEPIAPVLAGFKTLHLDVCLIYQSRHPSFENGAPFQDIFDGMNTRIRRFLSRTPNVTSLRFNFQRTDQKVSYKLLNWLATVPGTDPVARNLPWISETNPDPPAPPPWDEQYNPTPVALPLTQLDLGAAHVSTEIIQRLCAKFSNLKGISLFHTSLWPPARIRARVRTNMWASVFKELSVNLSPHLKTMKLRMLRQADTENPDRQGLYHVNFDGNVGQEIEVSKKGLVQLAEKTKVDWPDIIQHEDDSDDDEEDSEDM